MNLRAARATVGLLAFIFLTTGLLGACGGSERPPWAGQQASSQPASGSAPSDETLGLAQETANRLLDAFKDRDYDRQWAMLSPDAHARWGSEDAFRGFLERKFGPGEVSYELGDPQPSSQTGAVAVP